MPIYRVIGLVLGLSLLSLPGSSWATDATLHCDVFPDPLVPTPRVAEDIFRAVLRGQSPTLLKKFPQIHVEDGGNHWAVGQSNGEPKIKQDGNSISVTRGGGEFYVTIDKCSGKILSAAYNR